MKNILFATTALVATAGVASADIAISGKANAGVADFGAGAFVYSNAQVVFTMTGEADNGLTFGGSIDLDESDGSGGSVSSLAFGNTTQGGETYFLSYGGLRLDMGDTDGAYDAALQEVALAGASIADDETSHAGYNGNSGLDGTFDGQIARVSYSAAGFTAGLSAEIDDTGNMRELQFGFEQPEKFARQAGEKLKPAD